MRKRFIAGFTLLEILVALMILAIISVILVTGLRSVINTKSRVDVVSARLSNAQVALTIISSDMRQIINRPVYDNDGSLLPAIILYSGPAQELEFTRDGYINPMGQQQRSTLQRVVYRWNNGNLERGSWQVIDRINNSQPSYQVLIPNVTNIQWKFLAPQNSVYDSWPSPKVSANIPLPIAVELIITIKDWGTIHRWFVVESYQVLSGVPQNA